jgi:hypothetical protein
MFFRKKTGNGGEDDSLGKLDEIVGGDQNPVADGIRRALQRDDLTPEDRREFEEALKRLSAESATTPPAEPEKE